MSITALTTAYMARKQFEARLVALEVGKLFAGEGGKATTNKPGTTAQLMQFFGGGEQ